MNFETRQFAEDLLTEWENDLMEIFDRTEPTKWNNAATTLKGMFSVRIDQLLKAKIEEYGYFD